MYSAREFQKLLASPFGRTPAKVSTTRTFKVDAGAISPVYVHTSGRRPSTSTVRALRAGIEVMTVVYGAYPHTRALEVFLHDNPARKSFPHRSESITVDHVNSGFSDSKGRIVVLRSSEMHRTLVHELIHVWRTHGRDHKTAQLRAITTLGAPPQCLLTESFVEAVTWLIHGGFCSRGLDPMASVKTARAYLDVVDDGSTNAWAYFVGKAFLIADGGQNFHKAFFRGHTPKGVRLVSAGDHAKLLSVMQEACQALGGAKMPRVPAQPHIMRAPLLCACSPGPAYT